MLPTAWWIGEKFVKKILSYSNLNFLADKSSKLRLCIDLFVATTGSNSLSQTSCETIVGIDKIKFNLHMCVEFSSVRPIFAKNRSRMGKSFC